MTTTVEIPDWQLQLRRVRALRTTTTISDADWQSLADWLVETRFDETNFIAGEATALLISERAPNPIKRNLLERTAGSEGWALYWRFIIQDLSDPGRTHTIDQCKESPIVLIRQRGIQSTLESLATGGAISEGRMAENEVHEDWRIPANSKVSISSPERWAIHQLRISSRALRLHATVCLAISACILGSFLPICMSARASWTHLSALMFWVIFGVIIIPAISSVRLAIALWNDSRRFSELATRYQEFCGHLDTSPKSYRLKVEFMSNLFKRTGTAQTSEKGASLSELLKTECARRDLQEVVDLMVGQ